MGAPDALRSAAVRAVLGIAELRRLRGQLAVVLTTQLLLLLEERILVLDAAVANGRLTLAGLTLLAELVLLDAAVLLAELVLLGAVILLAELVLLAVAVLLADRAAVPGVVPTEGGVLTLRVLAQVVVLPGPGVVLPALVERLSLTVVATELLVSGRSLTTLGRSRGAELLIGRGCLLITEVVALRRTTLLTGDPALTLLLTVLLVGGGTAEAGIRLRAVDVAAVLARHGLVVIASARRGACGCRRTRSGDRSGSGRSGRAGAAVVGALRRSALGACRFRRAIRRIAGQRLLIRRARGAAPVARAELVGLVGDPAVASGSSLAALLATETVGLATIEVVVIGTEAVAALTGAILRDPVLTVAGAVMADTVPVGAVVHGAVTAGLVADGLVATDVPGSGRVALVAVAVAGGRSGSRARTGHAGSTGDSGPGAAVLAAVVARTVGVDPVVISPVVIDAVVVRTAMIHAVVVRTVVTGGAVIASAVSAVAAVVVGRRVVDVRVQAVGLGALLLHAAALLLDVGPLALGLGATALGRDLLLLGLLGLPLGLQTGAIGVELGLTSLQIALLDRLLLVLRLLPELRSTLPIGLHLAGLLALRGPHAEGDQDDQDDEHQHDDPDDERCGQFHGRLLAVDSSAR